MCDRLHAVLLLPLAAEEAMVVSHGLTPPVAAGVPVHISWRFSVAFLPLHLSHVSLGG